MSDTAASTAPAASRAADGPDPVPAAPSVAEIAALIDHAVLKPEITRAQLDAELDLAARWRIFSVCVRPSDVTRSVARLAGSGVLVGTVIGFPHGTTSTAAKVAESRRAIEDGAAELDMVLHVGALVGGELSEVEADVRAVVDAAGPDVPVKVILETALLTDEQIVAGAAAAERAGAAFVKTSTGFAGGGATLHDLALMRGAVSPAVRIKASGGVRGLATLLQMRAAGVDRFGTSSTETILTDVQRLTETGAAAGTEDAAGY